MSRGKHTSGGTSAAPAASHTVWEAACNMACATLPVTDITVATISHIQKNLALLRLSRALRRSSVFA
jgi:hypothetical protein